MFKINSLILFFLVICTGCSSLYNVDMVAHRQKNLMEDMDFLKARETITFENPLTLDDVVNIGLENNLEMRISQLMEEIADDNSLAEKLKMLPTAELDTRQQRRNNYAITEYYDPETGKTALSSTTNQEKSSKTLSMELSWNVLDFGLSYIRARQAAFSKEVKRMERLRQAQTLALEISTAYWRSLLAERNLKYIKKIEKNVLQFKNKTQSLVQQRRLDPIVAKEMENQWISLSISASNLQAQLSGMRIDLCRLMGLTPMTRFDLAEANLDSYLNKLPDIKDMNPQKLELVSLNNRPELFSADLESELQQDEARAALVSMFPGISFDLTYYYNTNKFLFNKDWYIVGTELVYNFLSLPYKYADWKAKKKSVSMARFQRLVLTAGIIAQVHMALHDYQVKHEQFRLQNNSYIISEELLDMSRARNQAGTRGFSDTAVTERMLSTLVARLGRDQSLVELLSAYNMLLVSLGLDYDRWNQNLLKIEKNKMPEEIHMKEEKTLSKTGEKNGFEKTNG